MCREQLGYSKPIHQITRITPDQRIYNHIDNFCIAQKFKRSLLDVRVKRGADAALDHHLVVGKTAAQITKVCRQQREDQIQCGLPKGAGPTKKSNSAIDNLQVEEGGPTEGRWKQIKEAFVKT